MGRRRRQEKRKKERNQTSWIVSRVATSYPQILDQAGRVYLEHSSQNKTIFFVTDEKAINLPFLGRHLALHANIRLSCIGLTDTSFMENLMVIRVEVIAPEKPSINKHLQKYHLC